MMIVIPAFITFIFIEEVLESSRSVARILSVSKRLEWYWIFKWF